MEDLGGSIGFVEYTKKIEKIICRPAGFTRMCIFAPSAIVSQSVVMYISDNDFAST